MKRKAILLVILAGICWGTSGIFSHILAPYGFTALHMTTLRGTVSTLLLLGYLLICHRDWLKATRSQLLLFLCSGVSLFGTCFSYFAAMRVISVSVAVMLMYTAPVLVMIFSVSFLGEKFTPFKGISIALMLAGCALVSGVAGGVSLNVPGLLLGLLAGVCYASYNIFTRIAMQKGCRSLTTTFYSALMMSLIALAVSRPWQMAECVVKKPALTIPVALGLGIVTFALPYLVYTVALREIPAGTASALSIVEPMSATVFSVAFLDEKLTVPAVCGIVLILLAVFLLSREENKKEKVKDMNLNELCPVDYIDEAALADKSPKKVIFLDRDGTIHYDKNKTHKIEDLEYFSDTVSALQGFLALGYHLVIVTNQNGIAEGLFDSEQMHRFNAQIISDLGAHGIHFDAIYYAPHLPEENHISYKPNCGMLQRAARELNIDLSASYMIGDKVSDVRAGMGVGVRSIMVTTGLYRKGSYRTPEYEALLPTTASSLTEALEIVRKGEAK